jgi:predicted dehydrogenase
LQAIWSRFTPVYERLRKELAEKTIGDPVHLNVSFGVPIADKERVKYGRNIIQFLCYI